MFKLFSNPFKILSHATDVLTLGTKVVADLVPGKALSGLIENTVGGAAHLLKTAAKSGDDLL